MVTDIPEDSCSPSEPKSQDLEHPIRLALNILILFFELNDRDNAADCLIHEKHSTRLVEDDNSGQAAHIDDFGQVVHSIIMISFLV